MSNMEGKAYCPRHQLFYDPARSGGVCPECKNDSPAQMDEYGATESVYGGAQMGQTEPIPNSGWDLAEPPSMGGSPYGVTEPAHSGMVIDYDANRRGPENLGDTMPPPDGGGFHYPGEMSSGFDEIEVTSSAPTNGIHGFSPVVGWLVCIDGPNRGKDYRIHPENNFLGRSENMDIYIEGDTCVSRDRQLTIAYVSETRSFYVGGAGNGKNIVKLNNLPLMDMRELHAYDVITVGSTKLMFVPFCGERFGWDE